MVLDQNQELRRSLLVYIQSLEYKPAARLVQLLLRKMGCNEVSFVGRSNWRGFSHNGGYDLTARMHGIGKDELALIQVKTDIRVQRRFVDELRGTMERMGADRGMIVTTRGFSEKGKEAADRYPGRPITLVGGKRLASWLIQYRLGVRLRPIEEDDLIVDVPFFEMLKGLS